MLINNLLMFIDHWEAKFVLPGCDKVDLSDGHFHLLPCPEKVQNQPIY